MKSIFVDTNFFLQCQTPENINWIELFDKKDRIQLLIPRSVQQEIDRLKQDGNSRRSKKARSTNSLIKKILFEPGEKLVVKEIEPFVEITFPPFNENHSKLPDFIDVNKVDDNIIAEILCFKNHYPNSEVYLLTHDTNPLLTARKCGINFFVVPDSWLLPPEQDTKDKKIAELEKYISELRKNIPEIKITMRDDSGNEIYEIQKSISEYKDPDDKEIEKIISKFKNQYPMQDDFTDKASSSAETIYRESVSALLNSGFQRKYIPPSDEEITKYKTEDYPNWIINLKQYISILQSFFNLSSRTFPVTFLLSNSGQVFAENVLVEFRAHGGLLFSREKEEDKENEITLANSFPKPPTPPKGRWDTTSISHSFYSSLDSLHSLKKVGLLSPNFENSLYKNLDKLNKPEKDKNAFYYKTMNDGNPTESIRFECEEFRHKEKPEEFAFNIFVPLSIKLTRNFSIEVIFSAKNLPEPVNHITKIHFIIIEDESTQRVYDFLQSNKYLI